MTAGEEGPAWPASALWEYVVELYGRPGVREACLALQDREGADVNLLLFACWLGAAGRRPDEAALARALAEAAAWQEGVVRPLRQARRRLKDAVAAIEPAALRAPLEAERGRLAGIELAAERAELALLERAAGAPTAPDAVLASGLLRRFAGRGGGAAEMGNLLAAAFPDLGPEAVREALEVSRTAAFAAPGAEGPGT